MRPVLFALCVLSACGTPGGAGLFGDANLDRAGQVDPGELRITEIMANPEDCSDSSGEWFEILNASRDPLEIEGLTLVDADGNTGTIRATAPIPAGSTVLVGKGDADRFCGPGATAFFEGRVSFNNSGESLALYNEDLWIDGTPFFDSSLIRSGHSLQLHPSYIWGSFDPSAWYLAPECLNTASNTPGSANLDCVKPESTTFAVLDSPTPVTEAQRHAILSASTAWIDDEQTDIRYQTLLRTGTALGGLPFGQLTSETGAPITAADGSHFVSAYADFTSLLDQGDDGLYAVTHFEEHPGAMYLTTLASEDDGTLRAVNTEPIDFSSIGGLWTPCAGSITPWGTHLGSEEYPSDGREFLDVQATSDLENRAFEYIRYYGFDIWTDEDDDGEPDNAPLSAVLERFDPYRHGYPVEVTVSGGEASVERHYALGRRSLELAKVMPDQRTVYLTDDGTNVALYMFVADTPGDLSAGHLYAMQWNQTGSRPPSADLNWISLGWADNATIAAGIANGTRFDDLFEMADPVDDTCPEGFGSLNIGEGHECLALKPGMEQLASRFESRRMAALAGATTELRKEEGLAHDPDSNTLFVALSNIDSGMSDRFRDYDTGGANHVRLPYNPCGAVFALALGRDSAIGSDYVAADMRAIVQGRSTQYDELSPHHRNRCDVNGIANPDNLTFVTGRHTLIIGEDTSAHINDAVWAFDLHTGRLDRLMTSPYGAESTSVDWHEDLRGHGYITAVAQHPYGESDRSKLPDPADASAWVGVIGPF